MINTKCNGKSGRVEYFFLDSPTTLKNRIAWAENTLPDLLYIENPTVLKDPIGTTIECIDILSLVENSKDIMSILSLTKDKFDPEMVVNLWTKFHYDVFKNAIDFQIIFEKEIPNIDINNLLINNSREFIKNLRKDRSKFKQDQKDIADIFKSMERVKPTTMTKLIEKKLSKLIMFSLNNPNNLYTIFDKLRTTVDMPLITFSNYYKILNNYTPPLNWESTDEFIMIKLRFNSDEYSDIIIKNMGEYYSIELDIEDESYDIENIAQTILSQLGGTVVEESFPKVGGETSYDGKIDNNIFADVILSLSNLPMFISVKDTVKHVNKYGSRYIYFRNPYFEDSHEVTATITQKTALNNEIFPLNTVYTNIKIVNSSNIKSIYMFKKFFEKIITLYKSHKAGIELYYKFFNLKEVDIQPKKGKKIFMKEMNKNVFGPPQYGGNTYARKCQPKQAIPIIINEDEVEIYEEKEDLQVMKFPKDSDSGIATPQYYICTDPTYKYPGLIKYGNALGVAPCCKKTDSRNTTLYKNYFGGGENNVSTQQQVYLKKTDKIIRFGEFGYLPDNDVSKLFKLCDTNKIILRRGVDYNPNSFLECILLALGFINDDASEEDRVEFVINERRALLDVSPVVAMQEMYGQSVSDIENYINSDKYLDPRSIIRLVEIKYNCNIVIFLQNTIAIPYHENGYYQFEMDNTKPTIFIYNHMGSESDQLQYPHSELLVPNQTNNIWVQSDQIYSCVWKIYNRLSTTWSKNIKIGRVPFDLVDKLNIQKQYIDEYGKVRYISVSYNNYNIVIETSPLPPLNIPLLTEIPSQTLPKNIIVSFMRDFQIQNLSEYYYKNYPQYIKGWYNNAFTLKMYIQSENQMFIEDVSQYKLYIKNAQIARYLTNWSLYLFSKYINDNNVEDITKNVISDFVYNTFVIDPDFVYGKVGAAFTYDDAAGLFKGNYLACTSKDLLKRIVYQLRLLIERNRATVSKFYEKQILDNYYMSVYDFTKYSNETIVYHREGITKSLKTLLNTLYSHILYNKLQDTNKPYFYNFNDKVVLSQNNDLNNSITTSIVWNEEGYNSTHENIMIREDVPYYLYNLDSDGIYQVGKGVVNNVHVATSEVNNKRVFTPLMIL